MTVVIDRIGGALRSSSRAVSGRSLEAMALRTRVVVVAVVLALALAAGVLALFFESRRLDALAQARTDALSAARSHATEILSYDYRTLEEDIARAKADTTGEFRQQYTKTASAALTPTATEQKAVVEAQVRGASVVSAGRDQVVVLLFVNQAREREGDSQVKLDQNRVQMTLTKVDDKWLVSKVEAL
ncbi:MAG: hypothetical protein GEV03_07150 [Streptosporangiales bacterium]|nr:hypothetical protein [Streptosporangiales bacterium]